MILVYKSDEYELNLRAERAAHTNRLDTIHTEVFLLLHGRGTPPIAGSITWQAANPTLGKSAYYLAVCRYKKLHK